MERPDDPFRFVDLASPEQNLVPKLGILCLEVDDCMAGLLPGLRERAAVVVAARAPGATFWEDRFEPGDVVRAVNGRSVGTLAELRRRIDTLDVGDPIAVQVERDGQRMYIAFRL